jgi:hypothetical protein
MSTALQSPTLINDFADFLTSSPSREAILGWRPSPPVQDRYQELTEKRKDSTLSSEEVQELEAFLNSEILLSLLKARLRAQDKPQS